MKLGMALTIAAVALAAALLRFPDLGGRPMHADEAVHADKFGKLLATGSYEYDPGGYHGTVLAYLTLAPAVLRGQMRYETLNETTLRLTPALLGLLLALTPLLFAGRLDRTSLLLSAALIACSPAFVYYSRCYVPETPLVLLNALALAAGWRYAQTGRLGWALAAGAALGAMYATKETAVISFLALGVACGARLWTAHRRALLAGAAAAAGAAGLLLSSFLLRPGGSFDSVRALFFTYLGQAFLDPLHRGSWHFYFDVLAYEWPLFVLAAAGVWRAILKREPFLRFTGIYALTLGVLYSALPYKTPWCALNFWYPAMLVAGAGAAWLVRTPDIGLRVANTVVLIAGFVNLVWEAWNLSVPNASNPENPYAYSQTATDVFAIRDRVTQLARVHPEGERMPLQIVAASRLWPLPWYLRRFPNAAWLDAAPGNRPLAPVILFTPDFEPALNRQLSTSAPAGRPEIYRNLFDRQLELRAGTELRGYAARSLLDRAR
jgi:uncharacterized protein (TIGR03663 family)